MATAELNNLTTESAWEPCADCGAPLASDQRYCLSCGARRGPRPIPRGPLGATTTEVQTIVREDAPAAPPPPRPGSGATFVIGLACLLLALGVGVLIGRGGRDATRAQPAAAPAQVITVQGGAAPAATPTSPSSTTPSSTPGSHKDSSAKRGAKRKAAKSRHSAAATSKATNKALKDLNSGSPAEQKKKADRLPKQVGTGGKPPPIDKSKPAGAGSPSETIG